MTLKTLEEAYWQARQEGRQWVQLVISRQRAPKNWDRVRVLPGLYGKVRGHVGGLRYLADVTRAELGEWLVKAQKKRSTNR